MDQKYHLGPLSHFIKMEKLRFKNRWYTVEPGLRSTSSNTSSSSAPCFPPGAQGFKEVQKHLDSTLYIHHSLSLYMKHCAEFQMCFIGKWAIILVQWGPMEMHVNMSRASRLLSVLIEASSNLEMRVRRDLFKLNYWFQVPLLSSMERVFTVLWEAKGYIKLSALALLFLPLFGETSEVFPIKINTMFLLRKHQK